ncbi:protein spire homolog 1-like [Rhinophrynus dorsalis]
MEESNPSGGCSKVTLKDILKWYGQPISEEQAWALCFQCCSKLKHMLWGTRQVPSLRGVESILIHHDGSVSFTSCSGTQDINQSEKKIIEHLGQTIYTALDWGLTSDMERVLSEPLDNLLYRMLGLHTVTMEPALRFHYAITLNDIIKVCSERLFTPSEASSHYRAVCRVHFAEHKEFRKLLRTIERSKQSLKKLEAENILEKDSLVLYDNWGNLWSNVIKELRLGIRLRNAKERSYDELPVESSLTPYELLMNDIRSKKYKLREVKDSEKNRTSDSNENFIMDFIRSQPLRPASERKLKERSQEEPSLHELLMNEIKSAKKLRSTVNEKKSISNEFVSSQSVCSIQSDDSLSTLGFRMKRLRSSTHDDDLLDTESDMKISWQSDFSSDTSSDSKFSDLTSSSTDLMFAPVLTSSQVDLKTSGFLNCDKLASSGLKRSSSFESPMQRKGQGQSSHSPKVPPPTIAELVPARREIVKGEMIEFLQSNSAAGSRVCFCCHKKRLFFTWPYTCKICERVICPECCVEMLMPFKQCMHLPVSFFKTLVLAREEDPTSQAHRTQLFCRETMHWDCSSVPLVFEPQDLAESVPFHKRTMKNWNCMDICNKCEEYILDVVDISKQTKPLGNGLKSRSASES